MASLPALAPGRAPRIPVGLLGTSTTYGGQFTGDCSLTKVGAGTLTLSGNSTNGANAANAVAINGGGLVGVTGGSFITPVFTVSTNTTFGVQVASAGGQWVGTNMIFRGGSSLFVNFGALSASTVTAPLQVLGSLTVTNVSVTVAGGNIAPGTYPLVQYGTLVGGFASLKTPVLTQPAGLGIGLSNGANSMVYMIVTNAAPNIAWGTNSQNWDISISTNWINYLASGVVYQQYQSNVGNPVLFADNYSPATSITVTLNTNVAPGGVLFSNLANTYTLAGSGQITGSAALAVSGANTVTIATAKLILVARSSTPTAICN